MTDTPQKYYVGGKSMNIRKNIDYGEMYAALDRAMVAEMEQMELYCAIGKAVSLRPEKGAAVAAAKYLAERYPDNRGFSPRNVRRMRDFYRTYENHPTLLTLALQIGWTQNVVIMEADLPMELREWYLWAVKQFNWSKAELINNIADKAHEKIVLAIENDLCYSEKQESEAAADDTDKTFDLVKKIWYLLQRYKRQCISKERNTRRWPVIVWTKLHNPWYVHTECNDYYKI